jgi:hypothetical protein
MAGYIYAIRTREFISLNEHTYKVGRTQHVETRFKSYPKGSEVIFVTPVSNTITAESELLKELSKKSKRRRDIGKEYFTISPCVLVQVMISYAQKYAIQYSVSPPVTLVHSTKAIMLHLKAGSLSPSMKRIASRGLSRPLSTSLVTPLQ